jgi:hypothetical protein
VPAFDVLAFDVPAFDVLAFGALADGVLAFGALAIGVLAADPSCNNRRSRFRSSSANVVSMFSLRGRRAKREMCGKGEI